MKYLPPACASPEPRALKRRPDKRLNFLHREVSSLDSFTASDTSTNPGTSSLVGYMLVQIRSSSEPGGSDVVEEGETSDQLF